MESGLQGYFFFCDHSLSLLSMVSLCTKSMSGLISPRKQNINTKISQIAGMHTRHSSGVIKRNLSRSRWWFHQIDVWAQILGVWFVHFFLLLIFLLKVSSSWISFRKLATFSGKRREISCNYSSSALNFTLVSWFYVDQNCPI